MSGFDTTYTGTGNKNVALVWGSGWGSLAKSPREELALGGPGEIDTLFLFYEGLVTTGTAIGSLFALGDTPGSIATAGSWYVAGIGRPEYRGPFCSRTVQCQGLFTSKPNRVRWFARKEIQSGENVDVSGVGVVPRVQAGILSVGCEIDTVIVGSQPNMALVGTNQTPSPEPGKRWADWGGLTEDYTYHWRNGWVLDDIRAQTVAGKTDVWLATYVYSYVYEKSP